MIKKFIKGKINQHSSAEIDGLIAKINIDDQLKKKLFNVIVLLCLSYISASVASLVSLSFLADSITSKIKKGPQGSQISINRQPSINYVANRKIVLGRNLFNSEGVLPEEEEDDDEGAVTEKKEDFDMNAPCVEPKIKLTLVGTIAMDPPENSLATLKDPGYSEVDIYKVGDEVIDHPGLKIVAVGRKKVILNNNGRKECLKIEENEKFLEKLSSVSTVGSSSPQASTPSTPISSNAGSRQSVVLDPAYVAEQIGEGYVNIMSAGRVVPSLDKTTGAMQGFKVFAIKGNSLLEKIFFIKGYMWEI